MIIKIKFIDYVSKDDISSKNNGCYINSSNMFDVNLEVFWLYVIK